MTGRRPSTSAQARTTAAKETDVKATDARKTSDLQTASNAVEPNGAKAIAANLGKPSSCGLADLPDGSLLGNGGYPVYAATPQVSRRVVR
jgi:hypothetical protein